MKLSDHTNHIRQTVQSAVKNRLGRLGIAINAVEVSITAEQQIEKERLLEVFQSLKEETGTTEKAYEKLVDELTFTLFNRIAALKVLEAFTLIPETITQRPENGNRSFAHSAYLEQYPEKRNEEQEGLVDFIQYEFQNLAENLPLYSLSHYYHLLPTAIELKAIIDAFNAVEADEKDIDPAIWQSDDVLGWLYESYNSYKKEAHRISPDKTEYDKVSIQSQWYTPKWVVKFLVDNSLGKQYLEMYPHSDIKNKYAIANAPTERVRDIKPLHEIKLIDPAMGSGNFLLYAFDVFYDLYQDQIDNYGADYEERDIPKLILEHNLYGVDLDNRAAQIAQLGLYIKARRKKRGIKINHFNLVSSDFILSEYEKVKHIFFPSDERKTDAEQATQKVVISLWDDLQQAHKFGALIRIEEIVESQLSVFDNRMVDLFTSQEQHTYQEFRKTFIDKLKKAIAEHASSGNHNFMDVQATNAVTYLDVLTNKYDVAVANPPYTDSADFGPELKTFVEKHYKKPFKFHTNLYATFIKRCCELTTEEGKVAMIHPGTFKYIKTFEDVRRYILEKTEIDILAELGLGGVFLNSTVQVDATMYVIDKNKSSRKSVFIDLKKYKNHSNKRFVFADIIDNLNKKIDDSHIYEINQEKLKIIDSWPFIYWISDEFREKFDNDCINDVLNPRQGIATGSNERCVRFWWEVDKNEISQTVTDGLKWKNYAKGGPYKKWFGNNWALIDFSKEGYDFLNNNGNHLPSKQFYFQIACTYSASGSKGVSFRLMEENSLFDVGGSCIFMGKYSNPYYTLALLNSNLTFYIAKCFNPTVNTQVGDIKRLPFVVPNNSLENQIEGLVKSNIEKTKELNKYSIIEQNYEGSYVQNNKSILNQTLEFIEYQIKLEAYILFNEYILNELIFNQYSLNHSDRLDVENSFGKLLCSLPILEKAKNDFINEFQFNDDQIEYLNKISIQEENHQIIEGLETLYQANNNLEEFAKKNQVNPINVWYWFKEANILPMGKAKEITLEFVTDHIRTLFAQDDDGIIPLYQQALETRLLDRLVAHLHEQGFSAAQIAELDTLLGKPLEKYIEDNFFEDLANHLNLFKHLPLTPFIWHLSSGKYKAFEVYTSIYQWNRDSIFKLKSVYVAKRREQLQLRQTDIREAESAAAQAEKELIANQLIELEAFEAKLDELIAENYNPILDSGVAKNIAPLQKKGMIKADILKAPQLKKYLNADW